MRPAIGTILRMAAVSYVYGDFRLGDVRHSQADIEKAKQLLGYLPIHMVDESMRESVKWFCDLAGKRQ